MRLLLIEDDPTVGDRLADALTRDGFSVDWTRDVKDAEAVIGDPNYRIVLLDLSLAGRGGSALLKFARISGVKTPILILTSQGELSYRLDVLALGADDYLVKPFEVRELRARARALVRRGGGHASPRLSAGRTLLDTETHELTRDEKSLALPPREFALMLALMERPGRVMSRKDIEDRIYGWGEEIESSVVEYLIHSLRGKFDQSMILNVRGLGWRVGKS